MNQTIIWFGVKFSKFMLGQCFNIILSYGESIKLIHYKNSLKFIQGGCRKSNDRAENLKPSFESFQR